MISGRKKNKTVNTNNQCHKWKSGHNYRYYTLKNFDESIV